MDFLFNEKTMSYIVRSTLAICILSLISMIFGCIVSSESYRMELNPNLAVPLPKEKAINYLRSIETKCIFSEDGIISGNATNRIIPFEHWRLTVKATSINDGLWKRNVQLTAILVTKTFRRNTCNMNFVTKGGGSRELFKIRKQVEMTITALVSLGVQYYNESQHKGTDFSKITDEQGAKVESIINNRPRKC